MISFLSYQQQQKRSNIAAGLLLDVSQSHMRDFQIPEQILLQNVIGEPWLARRVGEAESLS